jgi:hypothetical protein
MTHAMSDAKYGMGGGETDVGGGDIHVAHGLQVCRAAYYRGASHGRHVHHVHGCGQHRHPFWLCAIVCEAL